jgi:membrane protein
MRRLLSAATRTTLSRRARQVVEGFGRHNLLTYASAMSFQILFALVPFAFFGLALLGLLGAESLWTDHLANDVRDHVSAPAFQVIDDTVTNVFEQKRVFWLSAGLLIALWEISAAVRAIMGALDSIQRTRRRRSLRERLVTSIALAAIVGSCVLAALVVVRLGPLVLGSDPGAGARVVSVIVRWAAAVVLLVAAVGLLVRYAPATRRPVRWVSLGTGLVVTAWALGAAAYGVYVTQIADYGSIFGALSVVIVLMTFLYVSSVAFLAGIYVDELIRREVEGLET